MRIDDVMRRRASGVTRPSSIRSIRWLVVALVVSLMAACALAEPSSPAVPSGQAPLATGTGGSDRSADTMIDGVLAPAHIREVLIAAGVRLLSDDGTAVVAGPTDDAPIILVDSTIEPMSAQAATQSGTPGALLDDLAGGAPMALPPSVILAAYTLGVQTPGADIARAALDGQDLTNPRAVIFPSIVYILFAADAVHELGVRPATAMVDFDAGISLAAFTPCSAFQDIVFGSINKVFDWLKVPAVNVPKTGIGFIDGFLQGLVDVVVDGVNIVVEAGRTIVVNLVRFALADIIDLVAKAATIAALVGTVLFNVQPLSLSAALAPPLVTRGASAVTSVITVTGTTGGVAEWPEWLNGCAMLATGRDLPPLKPVGSTVDWTPIVSAPIETLLHRSSPTDDTLTDVAGSPNTEAKLTLETDPETADQMDNEEIHGTVRVNIRVHRTGLDQVQAALVALARGAASSLTSHLPQPFKGYIDGLIAPAIQEATGGFTTLLDVHTFTFVDVIYHGDKKRSPSPSARSSSPTGSQGPALDVCSLLTDVEVSSVIGVPIARHETHGTPEAQSCIKGSERVVFGGSTEGIFYASFSIFRGDDSLFGEAAGQPGAMIVSGLGDQAVFIPAGAVIGLAGRVEYTLQVVIAGHPASQTEVLGLARLFVSRL